MGARPMTIFGVGPVIVTPGYAVLALAWWLAEVRALPGLLPFAFPGQEVVGWGLIAPGILVIAWTLARLRAVRRAGRLDTAGPFAWTRNPVYAAQILLVMPGITICVGIGAMAFSIPVTLAMFAWLVGVEERALAAAFGEEYERYRRAVPRLLPLGAHREQGKGSRL